jgi:aldose 1-epimerase
MLIRTDPAGTTTGHAAQPPTEVLAYTLDAGNGFSAVVWTYGATLVEMCVPRCGGCPDNVSVRLPSLRDYECRERNPYVGCVLGRYCRMVSGASFGLDGVEHTLDRDPDGNHLHGGRVGFDRYAWESDAERDGDALEVRLRLDSPDGDQGYPGDLTATVSYRLLSEGALILEFTAVTTVSTIVGLTNHAYWNLAGASEPTIDSQQLAINARSVLAVDGDRGVLPGPPVAAADAGLDFSRPRPIGPAGIDNFFVLEDSDWAAELYDERSGRLMRMVTDQPGLGVYTGERLSPPRAGLSLQASAWPDAPNRPDFPSCRLDPGSTYRQRTTHRFSLR